MLFNINIIDFFLIEQYKSDFSDCADDTAPYNCGNTFLETISDLETTIDNLFGWFYYNNVKANLIYFYHLLIPNSLNIKSSSTEGTSSEKFVGVTIDSNFTFEKQICE